MFRYLVSILVVQVFLLSFGISLLFAGCRWIDTTGEVTMGENVSPAEARQLAINLARLSAIEKGVGVKIQSITLVKDSALLTDIVQALSQGYIAEESLIEWEAKVHQEAKGSFPIVTFIVKLRVCVSGSEVRDPYFLIRASLNRETFREREDAG